jgi:hypothetical protein
MEKKIMYSNSDEKIVDLEEYKKSPLHQQRLEENVGKPKVRKEPAKKKAKQPAGKNPFVKGDKKKNPNFKQKAAMPVRSKENNMAAFFIILAVLAVVCLAVAFVIQSTR